MVFIEENDCMGMRKKVWLLGVNSQQRVQLLASRENIYRASWFADGRIALLASVPSTEGTQKTHGWIVTVGKLSE